MIDIGKYENCVCKHRGQPHKSCDGVLSVTEKGKKVMLMPKPGEEAKVLVADGCIFNDTKPKCDALFILKHQHKSFIILVELKGTNLNDAVEQLAYTKYNRNEYVELITMLRGQNNQPVRELAFIVSNYMPTKREIHDLEKSANIRIRQILYSDAIKPIPDLRDHI